MSVFDPVYIGVDEFGLPTSVSLIERNMLIGGEPGAGKSSLVNTIVAHLVLSHDCDLVLMDPKQVEMWQWQKSAKVFVGPDIVKAISVLRRLQILMDKLYEQLRRWDRRKIERGDAFRPIALVIDELAYFSATVGDKKLRELFSELLRDLVARGRAVGIIVIAATQRPSSDIIPTSLRDLFAWRFAGRCTTDASSDIVLGRGWADKGYTTTSVDPNNRGLGLLLAEDGVPALVKPAYLDDFECARIAAYAAMLRASDIPVSVRMPVAA
ncbi:FtsK/SpoIIIE domain-containing protein [Catenuloplanes atrovinosus]|uniref:FtsK/SpoIIIE domain-containing protein n=1 Tax=Catenuloplanes atrovinosus TaxID=137266 RepID=UPI0035B514F4